MVPTRHFGSRKVAVLRGLLAAAMLVASQLVVAAAPAVSEDVPIPGGITAMAKALGLDQVPDHARLAAELARFLYDDLWERRNDADSTFRQLIASFEIAERSDSANPAAMRRVEETHELVPIPLSAAVWSEVFRRRVAPVHLFAAIMSDRHAALLVHGLAALDDETLQFLADHPAVVRHLYEDGAPAFATFAAHLAVHDSRVTPPGGDQSVPLWEALLGEKTTQPERFIRELFTKDRGRLAYLYDTIGSLDSPRAAFALGLWLPDMRTRLDRLTALASTFSSVLRGWSVEASPFRRPAHDLVSVLMRVQVAATGVPHAPAWRALWAHTFDGDDSGDLDPTRASSDEGALIDAAWLVETLLGDRRSQSERLDQFAFGQRALAATDSTTMSDTLVVLRAFPRFRMLMLTLDRIGVRRPALYAALVRQAERVSDLEGVRARAALAGFQGAIAVVDRLARVRTIDQRTAETLLETLATAPFAEGRGYLGGLVPWLQFQLGPTLGSGSGALDDRLTEALAGAPGAVSAELVSWEGQQYRFDLVTPEVQRLRRERARQTSRYSIDAAMDLHGIAQELSMEPLASTDIQARLTRWQQVATLPQEARETVEKAIKSPVARSLMELVDIVLGEALLSLNYEVNLEVPRGAAWTALAVARRHDFGLAYKAEDVRVRTAWAMPGRVVRNGVPWHVRGAALGLDVAIPLLALRRIDSAPPERPPSIHETERDTYATSVALMNPFALRNEDRDAITEAVKRGRRRVEALSGGDGDVHALAREIAMDGWRLRALQWNLRHGRPRIGSMFSMTDLLYLGGGRGIDLHAWGMSATVIGCICSQLMASSLWTALARRPQPGLFAPTVADLHLHVAVALAEMRLPAALARSVLSIAVQDFADRVQFSHVDDWLARVRAAQDVPRERLEDYIAAVTVDGPLMPETATTHQRVP